MPPPFRVYHEGLFMFAIRSTQRASGLAVAAAAVGTCLLLGACGGGSNGTAASGSGGSSSSASSSAPATSSSAAPDKGLLTGNFCKDLTNLGKVTKLTAAQAKKIGSNRPAMTAYMRKAAADFDGLGKEGGPKVEKFMHVLATQYSDLADLAGSNAPLSKLKARAAGVETQGASGNAFKQLIQYVGANCS
jgi:hypothetical protein